MIHFRHDRNIRLSATGLLAVLLCVIFAVSCGTDSEVTENMDASYTEEETSETESAETVSEEDAVENTDVESVAEELPTDKNESDEFAPKEREKPEDAPTYENELEAKRAVLATLVLPYDSSLYTEDALNEYLAYKSYVNAHIKEVNEQNAWLWVEASNERIGALEHDSPYQAGDLPRFYLDTPDNHVHSTYHSAVVTLIYPEGYDGSYIDIVDKTIQVKRRGNSTRDAEKHPYTLKFTEKVALCGMDKGKKWILLANAFDKTMLRNKLALDFCQNLRFDYSPECEFVDVYEDGKYMGVYLLCEAVTDGKNRVDIDTDAGDALFELEDVRTEDGEFYIITLTGHVRVKVNKPEDITREDAVVIRERLNEIEKIIQNGTFDEIDEAVNVDSFVDFYIFKEYFKDVDAYYSSTRFYLKNNVLFAGPPWDCDLICGNASPIFAEEKYMSYCNVNGYGTDTGDSADGEWNDFGWFAMLWAREEFRELIRERWEELRPLCENIYSDNDLGQSRIDVLLDEYGDDIERNTEEAGWSLSNPYSPYEYPLRSASYDDHIAFLRDWLERRIAVVDELFAG